jgi:hypothetical protein
MGQAGHEHVKFSFGLQRFEKHWVQLVDDTIDAGKLRRVNQRGGYTVWRSIFVAVDALVAFVAAVVLTFVLRRTGVLEQNRHIFEKLRRLFEDWGSGL